MGASYFLEIGTLSYLNIVIVINKTAELPKIMTILGGYIMRKILEEEELDKEWLELILEARDLGISIEEVLAFLAKN
ncbi:hypothetical protein NCCP28_29740 [Niallia sp. NCCP-28]|nr:hypothetical protein NCCP28_29740 [Niallia sp. NCCP-28]